MNIFGFCSSVVMVVYVFAYLCFPNCLENISHPKLINFTTPMNGVEESFELMTVINWTVSLYCLLLTDAERRTFTSLNTLLRIGTWICFDWKLHCDMFVCLILYSEIFFFFFFFFFFFRVFDLLFWGYHYYYYFYHYYYYYFFFPARITAIQYNSCAG